MRFRPLNDFNLKTKQKQCIPAKKTLQADVAHLMRTIRFCVYLHLVLRIRNNNNNKIFTSLLVEVNNIIYVAKKAPRK